MLDDSGFTDFTLTQSFRRARADRWVLRAVPIVSQLKLCVLLVQQA